MTDNFTRSPRRIVITGARGRLGRVVVHRLLEAGKELVLIDREPGPGVVTADITNLGAVLSAVEGCDAMVHLAGIPAPGAHPDEVVYSTNVVAQFNAFEACRRLGVRRVIWAASIAALGLAFAEQPVAPRYFPVDEFHPLRPCDCYALSKAHGEQVAQSFVDRGAGQVVSLRFTHVLDEEKYPRILAASAQAAANGARELWSYVDSRDAAEACWLALEAQLVGHHALYISADDTTSPLPTDELVAGQFPEVLVRREDLTARSKHWSPVSNARARKTLGFVPRYGWR